MKACLNILLILVISTFSVRGQEVWSLSKCIHYAHDNNLQVKQAEIDAQIIQNRKKQSQYEFLPEISVRGTDNVNYGKTIDPFTNTFVENRIRSSNFQANANLDLFRGFRNVNSIRVNTLDYLASKYDITTIKNDIAIQVTNAYLLILFNKELVEMSEEQTKTTSLQITRIEKLVQSGSLPKGNLLELQAQLADEELQLINAENQVRLAHLNLLQLLQLPGDQELEIEVPQFDSVQLAMEIKPANEVFLTSLTLMPQIKSAELKLESSEKNLSLARSNRSPTLTLGSSFGTGYTENIPDLSYFDQLQENTYRSVGLSLFIPIFSKYTIQQQINLAKLQKERASYSLMLEKQNLRTNVENAYADAEASLKSYYANRKSLEALQESFHYAEKRFDAGLINSVDYNTNKNNLRRAESELTQSKYDYIFKRKILDFFQGREITF
jgi:outer membrane protein